MGFDVGVASEKIPDPSGPIQNTDPGAAAVATAGETAEKVAEHGTPPPPRRAAIVYNPTKVEREVLEAAVEAAQERADYEPSLWIETTAEDPGVEMAKQAVEAGVGVVLVAGGDGTVRAVAEGLRGSGVALALIPSGTGNLLARNLGLVLDDVDDAVATAFAGEERKIDLGVATLRREGIASKEERVFLVLGGVGLDAQMLVNTDSELKKKAGWLAYVRAIWLSLKGDHRIKVAYRIDGAKPRKTTVHTVMVGNVGTLTGDVVLLPDAELDDGVLDLVALRPDGALGWLSVLFRVLVEHPFMRRRPDSTSLPLNKRGPKQLDALRYRRGKRFEVRLSEPEPFELDGDEMGDVVAFTMTVEPGGLTVRVP
ncbi:diacylglycerol/lipid kinase family protein [Pseudactinotalea terrae]|uniref:diacylglycerol/lipid kinase family protein n=1 Tax=Pseudactinotalea terrae TaxID=1743262 RepID=UPI0012E2C583|nr:diacylglycerol kinase family protein [Pseudactinotalea terrae]